MSFNQEQSDELEAITFPGACINIGFGIVAIIHFIVNRSEKHTVWHDVLIVIIFSYNVIRMIGNLISADHPHHKSIQLCLWQARLKTFGDYVSFPSVILMDIIFLVMLWTQICCTGCGKRFLDCMKQWTSISNSRPYRCFFIIIACIFGFAIVFIIISSNEFETSDGKDGLCSDNHHKWRMYIGYSIICTAWILTLCVPL